MNPSLEDIATRAGISVQTLRLLSYLPEPKCDPGFGYWLAGFIDGEGCFSINKRSTSGYYCRFALQLRDDDIGVLWEIVDQTGIGSAYLAKPTKHRYRAAVWEVNCKEPCLALVALLKKYPLRAKKRQDFNVWSTAVLEWNTIQRHTYADFKDTKGRFTKGRVRADWSTLAKCKELLHTVKAYSTEPRTVYKGKVLERGI